MRKTVRTKGKEVLKVETKTCAEGFFGRTAYSCSVNCHCERQQEIRDWRVIF